MKIAKVYLILFSFLLLISKVYSKELVFHGSSTLKQTKFKLNDSEKVFSEKYQNVNGEITENWYINGVETDRANYFKEMDKTEEEEKRIEKEEAERRRLEEEEKRKQLLNEKIEKEKEFRKTTKIHALKKLVSLELAKVQNSFSRLDKYNLQDYFVFECETFDSEYVLENIKTGLVNRAKEITIRPFEDLNKKDLKSILCELEIVPSKVERFFRKSVQYAINNCDDTRRLKELLSLI